MAMMENRILAKCDGVIVQTQRDKEWLSTISQGNLDSRVFIIPNGVDTVMFRPRMLPQPYRI
jgi:hypothetical protein